MNIGERIKLCRKELGMTQQELCDTMGYTDRSTIAKIEQGLVDLSYTKLEKFASVLGVDVTFLTESPSDSATSIPESPQNNTLGNKIKQARLAKGLTQTELGKLLGVEKSAIAKYENGRVVNLKHTTLLKLTHILDLSPSDLVIPAATPQSCVPSETKNPPNKEKLLDIILRLSTDSTFLNTVETVHSLNSNQLIALQNFFDTFILPQQNLEK